MPIATLYVEGGGKDPVESAIFTAIFAGKPLVEAGGSKGSLKPKARDARGRGVTACYVRDRDFDRDPPAELSAPIVDTYVAGQAGAVLGWVWCRHEIESYLIDPAVVAAAAPALARSFPLELIAAAEQIQSYAAARWAIGVARRELPPLKELPTRPPALTGEFEVVSEWRGEYAGPLDWATDHAGSYAAAVTQSLAAESLKRTYDVAMTWTVGAIEEAKRGSFAGLLAYFSGKDLMAALAPSAYGLLGDNPKVLRRSLRDWLRNHPDEALRLLPEWGALRVQLLS